MLEITNEAAEAGGRESQRIAPKVPLEGDDGNRHEAAPEHRQRRLSTRETRVEETQTRYHDYDHGRGHDNVGLVAGGKPLVEVDGSCT